MIKRICSIALIMLWFWGFCFGTYIIYILKFQGLDDSESARIVSLYTNMQVTTPDLKSQSYLNTFMNYLPRDYVFNELRKDAMTYAVVVCDSVSEMLDNEEVTPEDVVMEISNMTYDMDTLEPTQAAYTLMDTVKTFLSSSSNYASEMYLTNMSTAIENLLTTEDAAIKSVTQRYMIYQWVLIIVMIIGSVVVFIAACKISVSEGMKSKGKKEIKQNNKLAEKTIPNIQSVVEEEDLEQNLIQKPTSKYTSKYNSKYAGYQKRKKK